MRTRENIDPPKWPNRFLAWFCDPRHLEIVQGDLYEIFVSRVRKQGVTKARLLFFRDVLDLMRPFAFRRENRNHNRLSMFRNYFKISYRNFLRQKVYSIINVTGLAIGLACSLLIYLYVQDELSYDTIHSRAERIYRIPEIYQKDGVGERSASNPFALGPSIILEYPHLIAQTVRFFNFQSPVLSLKNTENNIEFNEQRLFLVDSTLFEVFDFELLSGNPETALDEPNSILLTETLAYKYFGYENPLGKTLLFQGKETLIVRGVLKDIPLNTHFQFDGLISYSTIKSFLPPSWLTRFFWNPCWTYLLLHDNSHKAELEQQLPHFVQKYFPERKRDHVTLFLQPLLDIHLTSNLDYEIRANGNKNNVYVFGTVALFVLLIASINFINLSTARASKRAKEVGIRKTLGSKKTQLISQFIFESILYTLMATAIAVLIVLIVLPRFNVFTEKDISLLVFTEPALLIYTVILILSVGLLSGLYPALVLSSFDPVRVLKGGHLKAGGLLFRKILVIVQFSVSALLIIGTIVAVRQLDLLRDENLGFDREQVVMVHAMRSPIGPKFETIRQEMSRHPDVLSVTAVEEIVGAKNQVGIYHFEGMDTGQPFPRLSVRHDFIKTFGIGIVAGRDYSEDVQSDDELALLVNESLVRSLGWKSNDEAIGKQFYRRDDQNGRIIGVVKDFNYAPKHVPIAPLVMDLRLNPSSFELMLKYMAVRVSGKNTSEVLSSLDEIWKNFIPEKPLEYFFLDGKLAQSYKDEEKLSQLTTIFSGLAIIVACLGLFGLATFITDQRTKEIGIRKVLGIRSSAIIYLLSRDFIQLISVALLITLPVGYYLFEAWLNDFAYRISIGIAPFILAALTIFLVAFLTISYHGLRAIHINPAKILKDE